MITDEQAARMHDVMGQAFRQLAREGFQPIEVNAFAMGMCRKSLAELVGVNAAAAMDAAARRKVWGE